MGFIRKNKREIVLFIGIVILFFATRFYNILALPIFTDEAIYVRWTQIAKQDANWRFISLTDGKQPMFVWLAALAMKFISDPLLAGRTVSVFAGFASLVGSYFIGKELFKNKWIGILCSLLYCLYPMALVYDKMALYDSLVGAFMIWGFYFAVLLVKTVRLDVALIHALIIGGGMLTKTNAFFNLYLLPATILLFDVKKPHGIKRLLHWIGLVIVIIILSNLYYSILRLSPFSHIISEKNALFVYPFKEWIQHPFTFFWGNLSVGEWDWLRRYMTYPLLFLIVLSFIINKNFLREKLLLFIWFFVPFLALALFGNSIYPRFIFFMTLFLLPLVAFSLWEISQRVKRSYLSIILPLAFMLSVLYANYFLLFDFARAPIPISDLNQYNNDWPSGSGIRESIQFFQEKANTGKIFVATQGTFGMMPAVYEIYLIKNKNIEIKGYWPIGEKVPDEVIEKSKQMPTYFVFREPCNACANKMRAPSTWNVLPVFEYKMIAPQGVLTVYEIKPQ